MTPYRKGLLLTGSGVILISPDAVFIRLIDAPVLDLMFWRGAMMAFIMCLFVLVQERKDIGGFLAQFTLPVLYAAAISVVLNFLFIFGITHTSTASALAILAATPLFAAVIGWIFLRERLSWYTWAAAVFVVALISGIVGEALFESTGYGVLAALGASVMLAVYFTIFRAFPDISRRQVFTIAGVLAALVAGVLSTPFDFDQRQMTLTLVLTIFIMPAATILMTLGPRYLPAAEVSLLVLLESVLGPIWVFAVIGEVPSTTTMICGGAILVCVAWHAVMVGRTAHR